MAFGAQVFNADSKQWVDVVQPTWVLDQRTRLAGTGILNYYFNPNLFNLKALVMNYYQDFKHKGQPSFTTSVLKDAKGTPNGIALHYSLPVSCTFLVVMEAK